MYKNQKISVVFPCRNEANHLQDLVDSVPNLVDEIVFVSNSSTDDTVAKANQIKAKGKKIVCLEDNRQDRNGIGYGFAIMTGIENATGEVIVIADADRTYPLADLDVILNKFVTEKFDLLSCNRYPLIAGEHVSFKIRLGVSALNWETRLLYWYNMQDILSGMWLLKKSSYPQLKLSEGGWNLSPQIKLNALLNKQLHFGEYHISYFARSGESKQNYLQTGLDHMWWIFKRRFHV